MGNSISSAVGSSPTISIPRGLLDANELLLLETYHAKSNSTEDADTIADVIPMDELISDFANWKYSHGKAGNIIRSVSAITSTMSSSIMIWMILRSHDSLSTTQHRLLIGLCISDIIYSLSQSTFNAMAPSENDYMQWNARGNQDTCIVQGFFLALGAYSGLFYNASLNLYFLVVIKYKKSDEYIRAKIEPFLHGLPITVAVSYSVARIVMDQYNPDQIGACISVVNDAPHCDGYDVGEVRDEFEIPCHRGIEGSVAAGMIRIALMLIPICIMIISLGMIYRAVRKQEKKLSRYGVGALRTNLQQPHDAKQSGSSVWGRIGMSFAAMANIFKSDTWLCKKTPNEPAIRSNDIQSQSRAVMHKAFGYTSAWFLSYGVYLIGLFVSLATSNFPYVLGYIVMTFVPLQGLFNLLIFMYPKIKAAKKSKRGGETVSWYQAFSIAFWSRGKGRKKHGPRGSSLRGSTNRSRHGSNQRKKKSTNATLADEITNPGLGRIKKKKRANDSPNTEEEKCEIQMPESVNYSKAGVSYVSTSTTTYAPNIVPSSKQTSRPDVDTPDEMVGMNKEVQEEKADVGDISDGIK